MKLINALRDALQSREDAWNEREAISREQDAVQEKRLTQRERDSLLADIERRENHANLKWHEADERIEDLVGVIQGPDLLAELKALKP